MSFEDKVVIVTGSSSGIGAATAIAFAREGANVVITGRNEEKLKNVEELCSKYGKKPLVLKADVSNNADADAIVKNTIEKFGKLDILVNNAGIMRAVSIKSEDVIKVYEEVFKTNVQAVLDITRLAVPHLIATKGNIVNISSVVATTTNPGTLVYGASKAAVNSISRSLALELAESGVRVNIVSPGPVRTDLLDNAGFTITWDAAASRTPLKKVGEPEEIANLVLFLASDRARSITGSEYVSDNGSKLKL